MSMSPPLVSADLLMLSRPAAPSAAPDTIAASDVVSRAGSAALVIAEHGRLKHGQGRASCRPRI